jgi:glycerophosphoryl diester phosphodiesterase
MGERRIALAYVCAFAAALPLALVDAAPALALADLDPFDALRLLLVVVGAHAVLAAALATLELPVLPHLRPAGDDAHADLAAKGLAAAIALAMLLAPLELLLRGPIEVTTALAVLGLCFSALCAFAVLDRQLHRLGRRAAAWSPLAALLPLAVLAAWGAGLAATLPSLAVLQGAFAWLARQRRFALLGVGAGLVCAWGVLGLAETSLAARPGDRAALAARATGLGRVLAPLFVEARGPFLSPSRPPPRPKPVPRRAEEVPFLIIGHMGAPAVVCENTLESFRAALDLGANALEMDLGLTRDGHVVVVHDWDPDTGTAFSRQLGLPGRRCRPLPPDPGNPMRRPLHRLTLAQLRAHFGYTARPWQDAQRCKSLCIARLRRGAGTLPCRGRCRLLYPCRRIEDVIGPDTARRCRDARQECEGGCGGRGGDLDLAGYGACRRACTPRSPERIPTFREAAQEVGCDERVRTIFLDVKVPAQRAHEGAKLARKVREALATPSCRRRAVFVTRHAGVLAAISRETGGDSAVQIDREAPLFAPRDPLAASSVAGAMALGSRIAMLGKPLAPASMNGATNGVRWRGFLDSVAREIVLRDRYNRGKPPERRLRLVGWVVNDREEMRALVRMGVDGLITDRPDVLRAVVGER